MPIPNEVKYSAKEQIRSVLEDQPEDATYDDILRELALERMVDQGVSDVRAGRVVDHETALRRIRR
ncbi:hypothetical protein [Desulfonatronum thioautotrophicum]|uniref:hypothetical protein n=1 Tax=Desulfonatronum thioautotrophicum TaxID=617001 RepID=UPI0005EB8F76|nr:hypothetical protein [Desulfonatronum thioautotrophicum]